MRSYDRAIEEIKMLLEMPMDVLCPGHAEPTAEGYEAALQSVLDYEY